MLDVGQLSIILKTLRSFFQHRSTTLRLTIIAAFLIKTSRFSLSSFPYFSSAIPEQRLDLIYLILRGEKSNILLNFFIDHTLSFIDGTKIYWINIPLWITNLTNKRLDTWFINNQRSLIFCFVKERHKNIFDNHVAPYKH